ncbi:hypothetical protein BSZ35_19010 [Salinibacter sp. 10B]|uniref:hypothetical protein n=1 Tax=Salinibacter sp. 10B TaxID=1923971 RepID=UPI000CF36A1B|nr:hypothetical protein [Salinibacter sp. 10B]PQJ26740.1 hypothetical protein BSZ35_19010 [Salinibacter sp. 10B]
MSKLQLLKHVVIGLWDEYIAPEPPDSPQDLDKEAYQGAISDLRAAAGGWDDEETARRRLDRLPDTLDGRRPESLDDVVECVCREVYETDTEAQVLCVSVRSIFAERYGVDIRRIRGLQAIGSTVPLFRREIQNGIEVSRLMAGVPGRN